MSREERIVNYYFYNDIDSAFFNVISSVKEDIKNRKKIFAKVMQIKKGENKHVIIYIRSSNDKLGEIDEEEYRLVYSLNLAERDIVVNKSTDITYGNVYDGNINIEPLNIYYAGKRKFQMFKNMGKYIDCKDEECVRELQKCDNEDYFVDDFTKFNDDDDKPYTHMFCRRYGVRELADKLNKINNFETFKKKLLELTETSDKLMIAVQEYLSQVGSDEVKGYLNKIRYPLVELKEEERDFFNQLKSLIEDNKYEEFKLLLLSRLYTNQDMAIKIKNALYLSGSSKLRDAVVRIDKERDEETTQKARELVRLANTRSRPSLFSRASEAMTYASKLARRSMAQLQDFSKERMKRLSERRKGRSQQEQPQQVVQEVTPYVWIPGMDFPYFIDEQVEEKYEAPPSRSISGVASYRNPELENLNINIPQTGVYGNSSSEKRSPRERSPRSRSPRSPRSIFEQ